MKYYKLNRIIDETGNSGTGEIAEVVVNNTPTAVVLWSEHSNALGVASIVLYPGGLDDVVKVHGHGGKTVLVEAELTHDQRQAIQHRLSIAARKMKEVEMSMYGGAIGFSSSAA